MERRKLPRVRVLSALHGYGVEVEAAVNVRDVSLGGFACESHIVFTTGTEHTFLFTTSDGRETMVRCQCRHARSTKMADGSATCVAGFLFLPDQEANLQVLIEVYRKLQDRQRGKNDA